MTTKQPLLYEEDAAALRAQISDDLRDRLNWQGQKDGAGQGLVQLFGRLTEIIIERLNRVPEQHFLAFLNEGGIDQLAPRAASTEIAFLAEKDGRPAILVPARTQVATRPAGEQPEMIFETVRDMQVIATDLVRCITVDQRTCADHTAQANAQSPGSFAAFQGDTLRERWLYLGHDTLLAMPDAAVRARTTITLHVKVEAASGQGNWQLEWRFWNGEQWDRLATTDARVQDTTANLSQSGEIHFSQLPDMQKAKVNDVESHWLRCQLIPLNQPVTLPTIRDIRIARQIDVPAQPVTIDAVLTGTQAGAAFAPVNPGDAFYPFGQRPVFLDGFYLRADDACTKPGATVELRMVLQGLPDTLGDTSELEKLTVDWEYFSSEGWTRLGSSHWGCPLWDSVDRSDPLIKAVYVVKRWPETYYLEIDLPEDYTGDAPPPSLPGSTLRWRPWTAKPYVEMKLPAGCQLLPASAFERDHSYESKRLSFRDTTCALTAGGPGLVAFTVPLANGNDPPFASAEVNGQAGYWIRARIGGGSYDVPRPKPTGLISKLLIGDLPPLPAEPHPPLVQALEVHYTNYQVADPPRPLQHCWSQVDQRWRGHSDGQPFAPFTTPVEHRALYLGFKPLPPDPAGGRVAFPPDTWIELYFDLEEAGDEETWSGVLWEYWDGAQWQTLVTVDETAGLQRRGYVGFFGPQNHQSASEFGKRAWWLRVSPQEAQKLPDQTRPTDTWMPRVRAIRLNAIHAVNAETIAGELLGSSTGDRNQVFKLARPPILPDLEIEVREAGEQTNQASETWVPWERAPSFLNCGPHSRCFVLDAVTGEITFGDGERGMVPPAGRNNMRAKRYRTHAGTAGNLPARSITVLRNPKDALNDIRLVTNVAPAAGGSDLEETAEVMQRGPYALKNRQRAVAREDFEWLARDVDGARRAFCLPTRRRDGSTQAGWVTVVVVPDQVNAEPGSNGRPIPSPQLLRDVRDHLEQRGLANLARPAISPAAGQLTSSVSDLDQVHVSRPGFVEVKVVAQVIPENFAQADTIRNAILAQLREFLDPLQGGPDRQGWEPGRDVYISEIAAEIERVPGVDVIADISLQTPARQQQLLKLLLQELRQLTGHTNSVVSAGYNPDGKTIVTASHDQTARIWNASTGKERRRLTSHTGAVTSTVYSPDGMTIVTASHDQTACIWNASAGEEQRRLTGHTGAVTSAAYSPNGKTIVTASHDQTACIWDGSTGQELRRLTGHTHWVVSAAYSPDGNTIVTASHDQTARIWDASTGQELRRLTGHIHWVVSAAYSPDGKTIVTASHDQTARIWDAMSGEEQRRLTGHTGAVTSAAYSPDGKTVVTASYDQTVRIWDARSGEELRRFTGHAGAVTSAVYSPDSKNVVTTSHDQTARIWDVSGLDMPAGSQVSTFDERIKLVLGDSLHKSTLLSQLAVHGLNVGDPALIVASDGVTRHATRVVSQLNDLVKITFDHPIEFVDAASFNQWLIQLGPAPGLAFPGQHFWLALPAMGQNAQFHTTTGAGKIVLGGVTVMGLKAEDPLAVGCEAAIVGTAGAQPLEKRRVSTWSGNCFWVVFDLPVDFEHEEAFLDWRQQLGQSPSLVSSDRRIQLPITGFDRAIDTMGRVHLLGVLARGLAADEPVSLTHATYHHRRIDFLPVEKVTPWVDQQRVFVPADYLVCSAEHEITMVAEATNARQAAQPG